jgi:hypothetical protein
VHRYEASSPGTSYTDEGVVFYARMEAGPGLAAVHRWDHAAGPWRSVYSTADLSERGYTRGPLAFYSASLEGQQEFDTDGGYVYWVRIRGKHDFNCCYVTQNPSRQTQADFADFALKTEPHPDGYEAIVCSPVCGTGGRIVWQGDVEFAPNELGGRLRISPEGPRTDFR